MRKLLLGAAAVGLLASSPAIADVDTGFWVQSKKDRIVLEYVLKLKAGLFLVGVLDEAESMAESTTIINQRNYDNKACENCAEKRSVIGSDATDDSLSGNTGIISVNQATGNMNNQGSAMSFSVNGGAAEQDPEDEDDLTGFADALAAVGQLNRDNEVDTQFIAFRESTILNSGNNNAGILDVNQAAGNMNNQANAISVAVNDPSNTLGGVALSESDLGQINTNNNVFEREIIKTADILGSFSTNQGVVQVNQASGNFANQANVLSLSAAQ